MPAARRLTHIWRLAPEVWLLAPEVWLLAPEVWLLAPSVWRLTPQKNGYIPANTAPKSISRSGKTDTLTLSFSV
jgi:hypothetical protein